jgi:hypothetical protein
VPSRFRATFAHWHIRLPPEDIANRRHGRIVKASWAIWYLFRSDEKGDYLDYYASHRMTNDRPVRIYADGKEEGLLTIQDFRICSPDPETDKKLEAEYYAENQCVAKLLEEKGFGIAGDEPGGVVINRTLYVEKFDND